LASKVPCTLENPEDSQLSQWHQAQEGNVVTEQVSAVSHKKQKEKKYKGQVAPQQKKH